MYNKSSFQKRHFVAPTTFPTNVTFINKAGGGESIDFAVQDSAAHSAYVRNLGNLDFGKISATKLQKGNEPFTAADFASSLKDGVEFKPELADDGPPTKCFRCWHDLQMKIIPGKTEEEEYGNLLVEKFILFVAALKGLTPELRDRTVQLADETTVAVMEGQSVPSQAKALPICPGCREKRARAREDGHVYPAWERTYSRARARVALPLVDQKIVTNLAVASNTEAMAAATDLVGGRKFGGGRPREHATDGRPSYGQSRYVREEKPKREWRGAKLELKTADAFDAAGFGSIQEALDFLSVTPIEELTVKGLAHAGSIEPIKSALKYGLQGRHTAGEAVAASTVRRPAPGNRPNAGRTVTVSNSDGKGKGSKNRGHRGSKRGEGVSPEAF